MLSTSDGIWSWKVNSGGTKEPLADARMLSRVNCQLVFLNKSATKRSLQVHQQISPSIARLERPSWVGLVIQLSDLNFLDTYRELEPDFNTVNRIYRDLRELLEGDDTLYVRVR